MVLLCFDENIQTPRDKLQQTMCFIGGLTIEHEASAENVLVPFNSAPKDCFDNHPEFIIHHYLYTLDYVIGV